MAETGSARAGAAGGAGEAPEAVRATSFLQRAVLRRRLRFLERRRELALHDLGGFVYESHRLGEARPELAADKLAAVDALDLELATLQHALDAREELAVLHEPGISSCPQCGTIHDSVANYCPGCGRPRRAGHGSLNGSGAVGGDELAVESTAGGPAALAADPSAAAEVAATEEATGDEVTAVLVAEPDAGAAAAPAPAEPDAPAPPVAGPAADPHAAGRTGEQP